VQRRRRRRRYRSAKCRCRPCYYIIYIYMPSSSSSSCSYWCCSVRALLIASWKSRRRSFIYIYFNFFSLRFGTWAGALRVMCTLRETNYDRGTLKHRAREYLGTQIDIGPSARRKRVGPTIDASFRTVLTTLYEYLYNIYIHCVQVLTGIVSLCTRIDRWFVGKCDNIVCSYV